MQGALRRNPGILYGITHDLDNGIIMREPKVLKVGIGYPKGPALAVWLQREGEKVVWKLMRGAGEKAQVITCATRAEAEEKFHRNYANAPIVNYPRKIGYFTMTHSVMENGVEVMQPDFEAIEAHGPTPTEIDIVLLDDEPFSGAFQMWSAAELKCKGDGVTAMRVTDMPETDEDKEYARQAVEAGERYFPIVGDRCWVGGKCPYSKPAIVNGKEKPSPCKPGGDLKFQLANNIRVGGTAYFHTTGIRSIQQIFSSLVRIKQLTGGRLVGVPLKMVLRPYKTNHNGQAATQYGVSLEFRAPDVESLKKRLHQNLVEWRQLATGEAAAAPVHLIEAGIGPVVEPDDDEESPISAQAMANEFYPEADDEAAPQQAEEPAAPPTPTQAATQAKVEGLTEKMRRARKPKEVPVEVPVEAHPPASIPAVTPADTAGPAAAPDPDDMF